MRLAVVALFLAAPLFGHEILRSDAKIEVRGHQARAIFTLNLFELTSPVVPGTPRATPAQLDGSINDIFASVKSHYYLRAPAEPVSTTLGQYVLIDGNVVHMEVAYDFADDISALEVESQLDRIMVPGHRHFLAVTLNGNVQQSILDPRNTTASFNGIPIPWWQTSWRFIRLGVEHIFTGYDHLSFLLGLLVATATMRGLVGVVTSFTLAHSITLAVATFGYASAPLPPLNAAIALSILFLGPEIIRQQRGETSLTLRHPWVVAFAFGLLHGFGFASGLTSLGLSHAEIPAALLLFNVGVEAGQLFFVLVILLLERSFRLLEIRWQRWAEMLPAYTVGSLGAYWSLQRTIILIKGLL